MATAEQIQELEDKMSEAREALLATVRGIDEARAEDRPLESDGEPGWSVKEQLSHLAQMEVLYRSWIERAITEDRPNLSSPARCDGVAYPTDRAHDASVGEHLAELARQRERSLDMIAGLTLDQYDRTAVSPAAGELTLLQWLRAYYRHDRMHAAQMQGRESGVVPPGARLG